MLFYFSECIFCLDSDARHEQDQSAQASFIQAALEKEALVDHSALIVDHLSKAYEQFKVSSS